jgi:hypothetical protein
MNLGGGRNGGLAEIAVITPPPPRTVRTPRGSEGQTKGPGRESDGSRVRRDVPPGGVSAWLECAVRPWCSRSVMVAGLLVCSSMCPRWITTRRCRALAERCRVLRDELTVVASGSDSLDSLQSQAGS